MSTASLRQTAKISSLEAGRAIYFIVASLALRQALSFFLGTDFTFGIRSFITISFVLTVFRFSHGVAVIYELEKKSTEISTTPSSMRVEIVFASFMLEAMAFFLMANSLTQPRDFVFYTWMLLSADLLYICISKTVKDAQLYSSVDPSFVARHWNMTKAGTAPRTHLQWMASDQALFLVVGLSLLPRFNFTRRITFGSPSADWMLLLSAFFILSGLADYYMNGAFYFGGKGAHGRKKCIFVCSPLRPGATGSIEENIRRAQWYCRKLYLAGKGIPYASHGFYPYFLDDCNPLESKLGRICALAFLGRCHAIYVFTPGGKKDALLSGGMQEEFEAAKELGLKVKFLPAEDPPPDFQPVWRPPVFSSNALKSISSDQALDRKWKKVFVCSKLRPSRDAATEEQSVKEIQENIRVAQWLCYHLLKEPSDREHMLAPFAPQAFYPFFIDYDKVRHQWLESTEEMLQTCEAIYVFTEDGLGDPASISSGMKLCIERADALGLEIKYRKLEKPPPTWNPQFWLPPVADKKVGAPASSNP